MRRSLQHFVRRVVRRRTVRAHAAVHVPEYANPVYPPPPPPPNIDIPIYRESIESIIMVQLVTDAVSIISINFRWTERFVIFFFGDTLCLSNNMTVLFVSTTVVRGYRKLHTRSTEWVFSCFEHVEQGRRLRFCNFFLLLLLPLRQYFITLMLCD